MACSNPGVILSAFERETGLPVLVNTSFNVHEEPIVNTPAECIKALRDAPHRLCRDGSRALRLPAASGMLRSRLTAGRWRSDVISSLLKIAAFAVRFWVL
jgi:hypothetical protein